MLWAKFRVHQIDCEKSFLMLMQKHCEADCSLYCFSVVHAGLIFNLHIWYTKGLVARYCCFLLLCNNSECYVLFCPR